VAELFPVCFNGMNRKAFLLGFYSIGGQVLLLRELVSSLNGDELFIGTALFGWLVSVAVGAYLGGRPRLKIGSTALFMGGIILLPIMLIAVRLSPLVVTDLVGEIIPFSSAAVISSIMMLPVGIISGWLFPSITREGPTPAGSIVKVYLLEGIGAFVGGAAILILVGGILSALQMAVAVGVIVLGGNLLSSPGRLVLRAILVTAGALLLLIITHHAVKTLEGCEDRIKYGPYQVEMSFDTHYGHQTILSRNSTYTLLTDNTIEAAYPDLLTTENLLIPPLAYKPSARKVLFIGRAEFGLMQLADSLPDLSITALDPRQVLSPKIDEVIPFSGTVLRIDDDPITFCSRSQATNTYDIIIVNPGKLDSYKNSRLLTDRFLARAKSLLKSDGIVFLSTHYDTDRFITLEQRQVLSIIYNVFEHSFDYVTLWPGNMTLLFASDTPLLDMPYDSIITRLTHLSYKPQYISENYLPDRLNEFKMQRLLAAVTSSDEVNILDRPMLPHYQALYRAKANAFDREVISFILGKPGWLVGIPLFIIAFFALSTTTRVKKKRFGLFLYFTAGVTSLSLELISFYVYQSSAGSLYSEMAVLIGAFMLGLAFGAYYSIRMDKKQLEYPALLMLLATTLIFLATFDHINPQALLFYHLFFLFVAATATGSLFVAATDRYYPGRAESNRGTGYACELIGSSVGALLSTTILLPVIGLQWLLISLVVLLVVAFGGSFVSGRDGRV